MINHIAIIMDWNRRWAKKNGKLSFSGHKAWAKTLEQIAEIASDKWIRYLTAWWLSTENYKKRSKVEILWIVKLLDSIEKYVPRFMENQLKFQAIWDLSQFPKKTQEKLKKVTEITKNNIWITLTLALIYWGQNEIIRWVQKAIESGMNPEEITEKTFREFLDCDILPEPDMIVRTGWDIRHSGLMLYDSAYREYYFTDKMWPDFDEDELDKVIDSFQSSKRNFWKESLIITMLSPRKNIDRKTLILSIFENILSELNIQWDINSIQRCVIWNDGKIISKDFFEIVHSDLEKEMWEKTWKRWVIVSTSLWDILIVHESENAMTLQVNTAKFTKIITQTEILQTWKPEIFSQYVEEIIKIETEMRENSDKKRWRRDRDSLERVREVLEK